MRLRLSVGLLSDITRLFKHRSSYTCYYSDRSGGNSKEGCPGPGIIGWHVREGVVDNRVYRLLVVSLLIPFVRSFGRTGVSSKGS